MFFPAKSEDAPDLLSYLDDDSAEKLRRCVASYSSLLLMCFGIAAAGLREVAEPILNL